MSYNFVSTKSSEIRSALIAQYESIAGRSISPSSPERLFIDWVTSVVVQERVLLNYVGSQNIPSLASGDNLDNLAELFAVDGRPQAAAAECTVVFTLASSYIQDILIPKGTMIYNVSRSISFATTESVTITAGALTASVTAKCTEYGTAGNGYIANQLVVCDFAPVEVSISVANSTTTTGGADEATDAEYREIMRESMNSYSTAGSKGAYEYIAKNASSSVGDVIATRPATTVTVELSVYSDGTNCRIFYGGDGLDVSTIAVKTTGGTVLTYGTDYTYTYSDGLLTITVLGSFASETSLKLTVNRDTAGNVVIYALDTSGSPVSSTIAAKILAACSDETVRPLTDKVTIGTISQHSYTISLTYYIYQGGGYSQSAAQTLVEAAVAEYVAWQKAKIGRDINPSKLVELIMATGAVKRVDITSPSYTALADGSGGSSPELAVLSGTATITYGGIEND